MKKIMIFTILFIILTTAFAQQEGIYNPFRHTREEFIAEGRKLLDSNIRNIDCNEKEVKSDINMSKTIFYSDTSSVETKRDAMRYLAYTNCQEVIDFYVGILNNDTSEEMHSDALLYLGWIRATSSIPFLLEFSKRKNDLSFLNNIAKTLCVMEEFELAGSVLDKVCFNEDGSIKAGCISAYAFAGRDVLVKNFYLSEWKKDYDEDRKFGIALRLTEYGIYDFTFSIIKEALLDTTNTYKRVSALYGLAAIATEEALELIQNCTDDKDMIVANCAKSIVVQLNKGRREE